tara:strand:- start:535 stop:846 length:312 start_codon:yes stop_codon:yes gene_type:complete
MLDMTTEYQVTVTWKTYGLDQVDGDAVAEGVLSCSPHRNLEGVTRVLSDLSDLWEPHEGVLCGDGGTNLRRWEGTTLTAVVERKGGEALSQADQTALSKALGI